MIVTFGVIFKFIIVKCKGCDLVEYFSISGNKDSIYQSIEYYQNICFVNKSIDDLRKDFINQYLDDYRSELHSKRKTKLVKRSSNKSDIDYVKNGVFLDEEQIDNIKEDNNIPINTEEIAYVSRGVLLDDVKDIIIEDDNIENANIKNVIQDDVEYVSCGVIIDDELIEKSNKVINDKSDNIEYVSCGVIVDSEIEEVDSIIVKGGSLFGDSVDELKGIYNEDNLKEGIYDDTDLENDDVKFEDGKPSHDIDNVIVNNSVKRSTLTENNEFSKSKRVDFSERNRKVSDIKKERGRCDGYNFKDVRDFVKKNSGCSISDIKEYFSIKDIKKALMASKIVEKRNKYYVV